MSSTLSFLVYWELKLAAETWARGRRTYRVGIASCAWLSYSDACSARHGQGNRGTAEPLSLSPLRHGVTASLTPAKPRPRICSRAPEKQNSFVEGQLTLNQAHLQSFKEVANAPASGVAACRKRLMLDAG
jgi:hypothetical protein